MPKQNIDTNSPKTLKKIENKLEAFSSAAGKTNQLSGSLIKCEVQLEKGEWVSPPACSIFHIDSDGVLPSIQFEIKTSEVGPFNWEWEIKWNVLACPQSKGKKRFKPKSAKLYSKKGTFVSEEKSWTADFGNEVIGGELTVKVKAGTTNFVRKTTIHGLEPGLSRIDAAIASVPVEFSASASLAKKIFDQESKNHHFYSDGEPLVSFDNGYGLGQATNPIPTYEQVWNWKKHIKYILETVIPEKRKLAKKYLDTHGNYTAENLDTETLVYYNGANAHYLIWDAAGKAWVENTGVLCDPEQSNKGWKLTLDVNNEKTLEQLRKGEGGKPIYTGKCYAEHINHSNKAKK